MFNQSTYLQRKELRWGIDRKTIAVTVIDEEGGDISTATGQWGLFTKSGSNISDGYVDATITSVTRTQATFSMSYSARGDGNFEEPGDYLAILDVLYNETHHSWVVPIRVLPITEAT